MNLPLIVLLLILVGIFQLFDPAYILKDVDLEAPSGFVVEKLLDDERSGGPVAITSETNLIPK